MKKILISFLLVSLVFFTLVFSLNSISKNKKEELQIAMVTDFSDVNDASFNQACYEGAKEWSKTNNIKFNYYKPSDISLAERTKSIKLAIDRGYNVILCPGYALGEPIRLVAEAHPEVKFIGLDITQADFGEDYVIPENVVVYNYHEEIAGYLAGYAAVRDGYRHLGYLGGIAASAVIRFGYGYIQGIDAAAYELKEKVDVQYVYGGQFFGDSDIYKYIDNWYKVNNTEVVFSCGGSIYTSVALAAKENNRKMIGVDTDQSPIIDHDYGEGICITSAMKGIKQTVIDKLEELYHEKSWKNGIHYLGLNSSEDLEDNYVKLPTTTWRMKNYSIEQYRQLIIEIMNGERTISGDDSKEPTVHTEYTSVYYRGSIK